jgi:hypothetical protein
MMEQEEKKQFLAELSENADYMKDVYRQIQDEFRQIDDKELKKIEY